jgi:acetyl esterase/lipase
MCVVYIHGGGMVAGSCRNGLEGILPLVDQLDSVAVSVDYRIAPEFPFPAGLDDCLDVLHWVHENAYELSVDRDRVVVAGASSGGAIAAGLALKARDSDGPSIAAQLLLSPMLDDRIVGDAKFPLESHGVWDMASNRIGWSSYLGRLAGTADIPPYAAPGRAQELEGLPTTFIDTGTADLFLEEDVKFAMRMMTAGVPVELHIWPGVFHGSEHRVPGAAVSVAALQCRIAYLKRILP